MPQGDEPSAPDVEEVLETVLYFTDQDRTEAFYSGVLGFRLLRREPRRSLFYRAGRSVLLLFDARQTGRGGTLPPHGARGAGHTCFRVAADSYEAWKGYLQGRGVAVEQEVVWARGRSFYFRDPDGNLLEIADADLWPA